MQNCVLLVISLIRLITSKTPFCTFLCFISYSHNPISVCFSCILDCVFWLNLRRWIHRKLLLWQLQFLSVTSISPKWRHFRFSVTIDTTICRQFATSKDARQIRNQFQSIGGALSSAELTPCNYRNLKVKWLTTSKPPFTGPPFTNMD